MRAAMLGDYPFVHKNPNRHGKPRYYFRRKGHARQRLPGAPGSAEFVAAYHEAMSGKPRPVEPLTKHLKAGSIAALVAEYERSTNCSQLAPLTRREMGYVLKHWVNAHGAQAVKAIDRAHILRWRDAMQNKPGAANKMVRTLKVLLRFAQDRGYRADNPSTGIRCLKLGEHRAWTAQELLSFEQKWPIGTLERTGFALALYTGQRRGDLVRLSYASLAGGVLRLQQSKTQTCLEIPIHPALQKALPAIYPNDDTPILSKKARKPLSPIYFGHFMAEAIQDAGLPKACVLHGLRKSATVALIDAGCSPHQASAITGHSTIRSLEAYAKQRDQAKLGRDAMEMWAGK